MTPVPALATAAVASRVNSTTVRDDPAKSFVEYAAPEVKDGDVTYSMFALKNRSTSASSYKALFARVYSGSHQQQYNRASLVGGSDLELKRVAADSNCAKAYCTYFEVVEITVPRHALDAPMKIKVSGQKAEHVLSFDAAYLGDLISAVEGEGTARRICANLPGGDHEAGRGARRRGSRQQSFYPILLALFAYCCVAPLNVPRR